MTTRPIVSLAQLEALDAAAAGTLIESKRPGEHYPHWRIELADGTEKSVTRTAESVRARGLIAKGQPREDGSIPAVLTEAGAAIREDLASREPQPVPARDLPAGVTCALTRSGELGPVERAAIADFQQFLTQHAAVKADYTARLKAMSASDPAYPALWDERASKLDELTRAYEAAHAATVIPPRQNESEA